MPAPEWGEMVGQSDIAAMMRETVFIEEFVEAPIGFIRASQSN
jgi:hypothetical protein